MSRPLRFGLITTFYPPYNFGGDGVDVQRLARALVARGHQVTVVNDVDAYASLAKQLPAPTVESAGIDVISLQSRLGVLSPLLTHQFGRPIVHRHQLADLFRDKKFDVVTFNNISLV